MPIEEKDGRWNVKLTLDQVQDYLDGGNPDELSEALEGAAIEFTKTNTAQEVLIVVDKGF